jgi:kinetochore protein Mis13/DSN1
LRVAYDEEDDGFLFKRVKKKGPEKIPAKPAEHARSARPDNTLAQKGSDDTAAQDSKEKTRAEPGRRKTRLSFSTPKAKEDVPVRRSKRLSRDNEAHDTSPVKKIPRKADHKVQEQPPEKVATDSPRNDKARLPEDSPPRPQTETVPTQQDDHSATKIALPFADTPVIKRNKAMREGKAGKGERRSSLGLRGRRASSLIETGNSNGEMKYSQVSKPS